MVQKSVSDTQHPSTSERGTRLWRLLTYLLAANELVSDKEERRAMGLSEEEIEGYEEFFLAEYFPGILEEV